MPSSASQYLYSVARQVLQEFRYWGGRAYAQLAKTPLPKIAIIALALLLFMTLIPLALTLFVLFFIVKLIFTLAVVAPRQPEKPASKTVYSKQLPD